MVAACLVALAPIGRAEGWDAKQVQAQLVADVAAVEPGKSFALGVRLAIREGWHVYWKFPGDAGLATSVAFRLPPGFRAGTLQWPVPLSFRQPGGFVGYGYDRAVLLWTTVTPDAGLKPGSSVTLAADVSWLGCRDQCVPGEAKVRLTLPVAGAAKGANGELFAAWRRRLPVAAGAAGRPLHAHVHGGLAAGAKRGRLAVRLDWDRDPGRVEWLPAPSDALVLEGVTVRKENKHTEIAFTAVVAGKGVEDTLDSLIVTTDGKGTRRGFALPVPLRAAAAKHGAPHKHGH